MDKKFEVLSERMKREPALLGEQLGATSLFNAVQEGRAWIKEGHGEIFAFGALWYRDRSIELGSLWVATEHRGKGRGSEVFDSLITRFPTRLPLFLITHHPKVVYLSLSRGMREACRDDWTTAIPWSASCGPCDQRADQDKADCPFRAVHSKCRLFFKA
jgi:GNAT superfamily N-acetyltransferase